MVDNSVVSAIVASCADITEAQVRAVLTALEQVRDGDPVGTVVQDPATGSIAVRVAEGGVPFWLVTALDGNSHRDAQPKLNGWTAVGGTTVETAPKGKKNA